MSLNVALAASLARAARLGASSTILNLIFDSLITLIFEIKIPLSAVEYGVHQPNPPAAATQLNQFTPHSVFPLLLSI